MGHRLGQFRRPGLMAALCVAAILVHAPRLAAARISFARSVELSVSVGDRPGPGSMALADVSRTTDRIPDLLVVDGENDVVEVFLGDEGFSEVSDAEFVLPDGDGVPVAVATGNFDNSAGRLVDVAVLTRDPSVVRVFRSTPDPDDPDNEDFDPESDFTANDTALPVDGDPRMMVVGRFNNDTRDDIAVLTATAVHVFLSNGAANGTFQRLPAVSTNASAAHQIIAAKLNGDELDDVAITDPGTLQVKILLARANGELSFSTQFVAGDEPRGIAAADFDADGKIDLLVADAAADFIFMLQLFRGVGNGSFDAGEEVTGAPFTYALAAFDVDKNGTADVVAASIDDAEAAILLCQPSDFCDVLEVGEPPLEAGVFRQPRGGTIPNAVGGEVAIVAGAVAGEDQFADLIILSDDGLTATLLVNQSIPGSATATPTFVRGTPTATAPQLPATPTPSSGTPSGTGTASATPSATQRRDGSGGGGCSLEA